MIEIARDGVRDRGLLISSGGGGGGWWRWWWVVVVVVVVVSLVCCVSCSTASRGTNCSEPWRPNLTQLELCASPAWTDWTDCSHCTDPIVHHPTPTPLHAPVYPLSSSPYVHTVSPEADSVVGSWLGHLPTEMSRLWHAKHENYSRTFFFIYMYIQEFFFIYIQEFFSYIFKNLFSYIYSRISFSYRPIKDFFFHIQFVLFQDRNS